MRLEFQLHKFFIDFMLWYKCSFSIYVFSLQLRYGPKVLKVLHVWKMNKSWLIHVLNKKFVIKNWRSE